MNPNRVPVQHPSRPTIRYAVWMRQIGLLLVCVVCGHLAAIADEPPANAPGISDDSQLVAALSAPMTSIVDGRSFRGGVTRICEAAGVNFWIDREVDPSRIIDSGPLGPTAYASLKQLAADHGCTVYPIRSVVLVGRESWVDTMAEVLLKFASNADRPRIDVQWPRLSTPREALAAVNPEREFGDRPHDLWPAVHWQNIDPVVAVLLVEGQLSDRDSPLARSEKRRATGRRQAIDRTLVAAAKKVENESPLSKTFSLSTHSRAAEVLSQLCAAAGLKCVIDDSAKQACDQIVLISEKDVTLRVLIETVATNAGVAAAWETGVVVFKIADRADSER